MSYLSVIPRETAKKYLRLDDTASDDEVDRMISSALKFLEDRTNVITFSRDIKYYYRAGFVNVYDGPITDDSQKGNAERKDFPLYSRFIDYSADDLTLTVGYVDPTDVPTDLIEAALEMIDYWFYRNDGTTSIDLIPPSVQAVIDSNKRFII